MFAGLVPFGGSEGESISCLSPSFWLIIILGFPWVIEASFHSLPVCLHHLFLCALSFSAFVRTASLDLEPTLSRINSFEDPYLNLQRLLLQISSYSEVPGKHEVLGGHCGIHCSEWVFHNGQLGPVG